MSTTTFSPLEAANARLLALRASFAADKKRSAPLPTTPVLCVQANGIAPSPLPSPAPLDAAGKADASSKPDAPDHPDTPDYPDVAGLPGAADLPDSLDHPYDHLPAHLGWGSEAVTAHLRQRRGADSPAISSANKALASQSLQPIAPTPLTSSAAPASVKLYPDIALALLREERVADGRLWLLLRALDENGRGVWTRRAAYAALTKDDAPYRLCSERQLRKLLERGDGLFWHQDEEKRIWLHSQARVAAALDIGRIQHKAIALPASILCQLIGDVRAHLYASFHSIRSGGEKQAMPISRQTLTALSGVCSRTQQSYEARAKVQATACIAIGAEQKSVRSGVEIPVRSGDKAAGRSHDKAPVLSGVEATTATPLVSGVAGEEQMWKNGRAGFALRDHLGRQGEKGKVYHACRLPNRYSGPHMAASGHGRRRLNRQLADLRQKGAGNGQVTQTPSPVESERQTWVQRYAADGASGARVWSKENGRRPIYWPIYWHGRGGGRGIIIWQTLPKLDR